MTRLADIYAAGDERGHHTPEEKAEIEDLILHGDPTAPEPPGILHRPTAAELRAEAHRRSLVLVAKLALRVSWGR